MNFTSLYDSYLALFHDKSYCHWVTIICMVRCAVCRRPAHRLLSLHIQSAMFSCQCLHVSPDQDLIDE